MLTVQTRFPAPSGHLSFGGNRGRVRQDSADREDQRVLPGRDAGNREIGLIETRVSRREAGKPDRGRYAVDRGAIGGGDRENSVGGWWPVMMELLPCTAPPPVKYTITTSPTLAGADEELSA